MGEILVLAELRQGEVREITFEALGAGRNVAAKAGLKLSTLLVGYNLERAEDGLADYCDNILIVEDERLGQYNSETYQAVVSQVFRERRPALLLMGHTSMGMDLAPRLAAELGIPLVTDCLEIELVDGRLYAVRQMYGGKLNCRVRAREAESYIATVRQGIFKPVKIESRGLVTRIGIPVLPRELRRRVKGVTAPVKSEISIESADIIVAVGRGIGEKSNIALAEELANLLGGVIACSRPIVDKGWLPSDRQVGSSGKTVKPKLYISLGISGAFQHVMGMMNSQLIIAVNKDRNAPIFNVAHYGVVDDLFKVAPALIKKIRELKGLR